MVKKKKKLSWEGKIGQLTLMEINFIKAYKAYCNSTKTIKIKDICVKEIDYGKKEKNNLC